MEVEMEDDIANGVELTFTAVEIDLDYEYDAARFFDFSREETIDQALQAQMWFDSIDSYPPSPFAVRLISREQVENANVSTLSQGFDNANQLNSVSDVVQAPEDSSMDCSNPDGNGAHEGAPLDLKSYCQQAFQKQQSTKDLHKDITRIGNYKSKTKSSLKPSDPRTSTLMKPTASQLAKQNQERLVDHLRFQKLGTSSVVEGQAAKRQKLEGGHLLKATTTNEQPNFIHKAPKREGTIDWNAGHAKLRITVPRPPELATAQRAQRIRQKLDSGSEHVTSRGCGFRALPLNRKIFKTPSLLQSKRTTPQLPEFQEFHLKTTERAAQNSYAVPSTSACFNNLKKPAFAFSAERSSREYKGLHVAGGPNQEDCETVQRYKAVPLDKKISSSKGDLGVFRSSKRGTTVDTTFNYQTEKRAQHAPPVDLFNKLSLASERQQDSSSQLNRPRFRSTSIFTKGLKENRVCPFQQQSEMKCFPTDKISKMGSKQVITQGAPLSTISRNFGVC